MSRIAERLASRGDKPYKILTETFAGPSSYSTGGNVNNSTIFRQLERATFLNVTGGYSGEVVTGSVSGNAFKLKLYVTTGALGANAAELPSATNLITSSITVLLEGF